AAPDSHLPEPDTGTDSRFLAREARRLVSTEGAALPRILRTYVIARAALGMALVLVPWAAVMLGSRPPLPMLIVCLAYAAQALSMWMLRKADPEPSQAPERLVPRQWVWTIGVDLLAFSALRLMDPSGQVNYAALLVLPVLMGGLLTRRTVALGTAATVALVLLLGVPLARLATGEALLPLTEAGLAGAGMFVIALLASELAGRLAREERSARSSLALASQQTQLNRLVIEEMTEGVLVVDRAGQVRAVNPAAHVLLGASRSLMLQRTLAQIDGLVVLADALERAYAQGAWPDDARELQVPTADGGQRRLQVRARFTRRSGIGQGGALEAGAPEDVCVLFLEDLRVVQARARQDKLAAMGRMSAGIAHEIRNPLAAIAQANALLLEDALMPTQRRLARIVHDNAERLRRIVDDVLAVASSGPVPQAVPLDVAALVQQTCTEWRRTAPEALRAPDRLRLQLPPADAPPVMALFDAEHLRRVLVNLLDNAGRHAPQDAAAVLVAVAAGVGDQPVTLTVASGGEPIPVEVERHLFEPFFSTRSRGSGLGLYICRELCTRHGAGIDYLAAGPEARLRNVFRIVMRRAPIA
ncbi:MAG: histidine kinase, partial [Burkholderiales bacterium PBB5]